MEESSELKSIRQTNRILMEALPQSVFELQQRHKHTWETEDESKWMAGLWEEVSELCLALDGQHPHTPDFELAQIAAIAINWLHHRAAARKEN